MWVTQFYKFETDDLLDEKHDMEGTYDSKSTYILKIKCTKIQNLIIRPVQNMDRWKDIQGRWGTQRGR